MLQRETNWKWNRNNREQVQRSIFYLVFVDELTRISRMKWIDLVVLLVFAANERLFVIFTELFVGRQDGAVQVNNEDKIEVFSIVRLVELTVLRQSWVECLSVILRRFKRIFPMKSLLCLFERIKWEFLINIGELFDGVCWSKDEFLQWFEGQKNKLFDCRNEGK